MGHERYDREGRKGKVGWGDGMDMRDTTEKDRVWDRRGGTVEVGWKKKSERGRQVGLGTR